MMAKLAPFDFTEFQSTFPCQLDTSKPCGWDLLSKLEGLALTRLRIDAKITVEHFMVKLREVFDGLCLLYVTGVEEWEIWF
jgi:hypothetical protein